ncbi:MAG: tetratricopeptide repeat protein [Planctomycetes bacterium]|nr:tetratricopeptide repeat protein [Planctomycetota bacterium]
MSDELPKTRPETLVNIQAASQPQLTDDGGETLLALDASGSESVLSRVETATGANLTARPVELRSADFPADSQATTRQADSRNATFTARLASGTEQAVRYESRKELGRGGMGVVLQVRDNDLRRDVAMKVMRADKIKPGSQHGQFALQRFVEEAQITGQLEHPNIVPIHELGADSKGRVFFTMKLVQGKPLADILRALRAGDVATERDYPLDRLLQIYLKVCDAMNFAHAHDVIHRDLKPENIMIGRFGEVMVMDWGLARILNQPDGEPGGAPLIQTDSKPGDSTGSVRPSALSMEGTIAGTPAYMAPEQARGEVSKVDQRADIFALGAILYELLVLRPPYTAEGSSAVLVQAAQGDLSDPYTRVANDDELRARLVRLPGGKIPPELAAIAMHALEKRADDRYPTVRALQTDVEDFIAGRPVSVRQDPLSVRMAKWVRRHPTLSMSSGAAAAVLLVAVASIMFVVAQARQQAIEQQQEVVAASRVAEQEAVKRADAEASAMEQERKLKEQAMERQQAMARRAEAARVYRIGVQQSERARMISDDTLRDAAFHDAVTSLEQASSTDPAYVDPVFALARLLHFFSNPRALGEYQRVNTLTAAQDGRGDARALVYAGDFSRLTLGDNTRALAFYEAASRVAPDDPLAMVGRGYVAYLQGDFTTARRHAQDAAKLDDALWEPLFLEGSIHSHIFKPGNRELNPLFDATLAADLLTRALLRNNTEGTVYNERGAALAELADFESAEKDFRRAVELMPRDLAPHLNLALALRRLARLDEAQVLVDRLLASHEHEPGVWMELGNLRIHQARVKEALPAFEQSLKLAPGRPAALSNLAWCHLSLGDFARAETFAQQAIDAEPGMPGPWLLLAQARRYQGNAETALEAADKALQIRPDWYEALAQKAELLVMLKRFDAAHTIATAAVAAAPLHDSTHQALGMAEHGRGNYAQAEQHYRRALELNAANAEAGLNLAVVLKLQGKMTEAEQFATAATRWPVLGGRPWYEVGIARMSRRDLAGAFEAYAKAVEITPTLGDAWINGASCANRLGNFKVARDYALQATKVAPGHILSWIQLCQSELNLNDRQAASAALDEALKLDASTPAERTDLAAMLYSLGRYEDAAKLGLDITKDNPEFGRAWLLLANIYIVQQRYDDAVDALYYACERMPGDVEPRNQRVKLFYQLDQYMAALDAAKDVLAIDAGNYTAHLFSGHCHFGLNAWSLAIASYEAAARANGQDATPWINMGACYLYQNDREAMLRCYEKAVAVAPANDYAWYRLGLGREQNGDDENALKAYLEALRLNANNLNALLAGSAVASRLKRFVQSEELAKRATEVEPQNVSAWYRLGMARFDQAKWSEASDAFTQGTVVAPKNAWFWYLLASSTLNEKKYDACRAAAAKAHGLDAKINEALVLQAAAECGLGNNAEALKLLRKGLAAGADAKWAFAQSWWSSLESDAEYKSLRAEYVKD